MIFKSQGKKGVCIECNMGARKSAVNTNHIFLVATLAVHLGFRPCHSFLPSPQLVNEMPHVTHSPVNYIPTPCSSAHNSTITMGTQNQDKIHSTSAIYVGEHVKPNAHQECMSIFNVILCTSTESYNIKIYYFLSSIRTFFLSGFSAKYFKLC